MRLAMTISAFHLPTLIGLLVIGAGVRMSAAESAATDPAGIEFFERQIRPLLAEACYSCHSSEAKKIKGGLRVDTYAGMLVGGTSKKPSVVPGKLDVSALIHAVRWVDEDTAMPPKERLAPEKV